MRFKWRTLRLILILIFILITVGISYLIYTVINKAPLTGNEPLKRNYSGWYYSDNFHNYSVEVPTQQNFSFYAEFVFDRSRGYFFAASIDSFLYPANENQIIPVNFNNKDYSLVNIEFPFLNLKENVFPYLNAVYLIKIIYLYDLLKFRTYLTDALRTYNDQKRYNRRGWSTVDKSPHMTGIASDMGRYFSTERKLIESQSEKLGLRFMQHGGRGNTHIHLQDNSIWHSKELVNNLIEISDEIHKKVEEKFNIITGYEKTESLKMYEKIYFKKYGHSLRSFEKDNTYKFDFNSSKPVILKSEIINFLGNRIATIYSGIYKNEKNLILIDLNFLPPGVYKIRNYAGSTFIKEEIINRF